MVGQRRSWGTRRSRRPSATSTSGRARRRGAHDGGVRILRRRVAVAGARTVSGNYEYPLDAARTAWLTVRFETVRREVAAYAVVLAVDTGGRRQTVRVYDSAHGSTRCIATRVEAASCPESHSMRVRLAKACA